MYGTLTGRTAVCEGPLDVEIEHQRSDVQEMTHLPRQRTSSITSLECGDSRLFAQLVKTHVEMLSHYKVTWFRVSVFLTLGVTFLPLRGSVSVPPAMLSSLTGSACCVLRKYYKLGPIIVRQSDDQSIPSFGHQAKPNVEAGIPCQKPSASAVVNAST